MAEAEALPLGEVGVEVKLEPVEVACLREDHPTFVHLARLLKAHKLLLLRSPLGQLLSPKQLRDIYSAVHKARWPELAAAPPPAQATTMTEPSSGETPEAPVNLRGRHFPGYPETNVLGHAAAVEPWHGLPTGHLHPSAWWEREGVQWHHDGGFSKTAPPPPILVGMYCEVPPERGGSVLRWLGAAVAEELPLIDTWYSYAPTQP